MSAEDSLRASRDYDGAQRALPAGARGHPTAGGQESLACAGGVPPSQEFGELSPGPGYRPLPPRRTSPGNTGGLWPAERLTPLSVSPRHPENQRLKKHITADLLFIPGPALEKQKLVQVPASQRASGRMLANELPGLGTPGQLRGPSFSGPLSASTVSPGVSATPNLSHVPQMHSSLPAPLWLSHTHDFSAIHVRIFLGHLRPLMPRPEHLFFPPAPPTPHHVHSPRGATRTVGGHLDVSPFTGSHQHRLQNVP